MIHWAHAFRVAARPSLDLSLPHAANTRSPFYTATARRQPVFRRSPEHVRVGSIASVLTCRSDFRFRPESRHPYQASACLKGVESRCGAVALGRTYLLPPLSSGGALVVPPSLRFHIPLIGRVEGWRAGVARGSRPTPRLQPPPRRTQRADFPHCAPPFASRQSLWDLSCRGDFRPVASHSIGVEQPESVVQPPPIPSFPVEALSFLSMRQMAPDLLLHPVFDEAEALAGMPHRGVVHPSP